MFVINRYILKCILVNFDYVTEYWILCLYLKSFADFLYYSRVRNE